MTSQLFRAAGAFMIIAVLNPFTPKDTLKFMLEAMAVLIPFTFIYTVYKHWVFPGKTVEVSYHGEGE
jgi:cytochrome bd-type quinol oxidase subunit 2